MNKNNKIVDMNRMKTFNAFYTSRDKAIKQSFKGI